MGYVIYVNHPTNRVTIHKDICSEYTNKKSCETKNGFWLGPFTTVEEAHQTAHKQGKRYVRFCSKCRPY